MIIYLLANSCFMTSKLERKKRDPNLLFGIYIPLNNIKGGLRLFFWVRLAWLEPDAMARQFYCVVGLLAEMKVYHHGYQTPDLLTGQFVTSKGNKARGDFYTRTNAYLSQKMNAPWHLFWYHHRRHPNVQLIREESSPDCAAMGEFKSGEILVTRINLLLIISVTQILNMADYTTILLRCIMCLTRETWPLGS